MGRGTRSRMVRAAVSSVRRQAGLTEAFTKLDSEIDSWLSVILVKCRQGQGGKPVKVGGGGGGLRGQSGAQHSCFLYSFERPGSRVWSLLMNNLQFWTPCTTADNKLNHIIGQSSRINYSQQQQRDEEGYKLPRRPCKIKKRIIL